MSRLVQALVALLFFAAGMMGAPHTADAARSGLDCMTASPAPPGPPAITLATYQDQIQSAQRLLRDRREAGAWDAAAILQRIGPVLMPDGSRVQPDLTGVIAVLQARPPDLAGGEARLAAVLAELDRSGSPAASGGGTDARDRLQGILARPEFHPAQPQTDPISEFLRRLWDIFLEWLKQALAPIIRLIPPVDLHLPAVLAGLLLMGGLIFWVVRGLHRTMAPDVVQLPAEAVSLRATPMGLRAEALVLAQRGEFRPAVRALYLAVLLEWDERGKLLFDRALTNREVLGQLRLDQDATAIRQLAPLVERFDRFWYGGLPCSPEDYAEFDRLAAAARE